MSVNPNSDHANVRTRVDKAYYNVFVSESNITNDLVLPTATINDAQTDDQNKGSGIDQLYDIQIAQSQIYSCNIIKQDDINITINNIQIGYNQTVVNMFTDASTATAAQQKKFPTPAQVTATNGFNTLTTLPYYQIPGLWGFCCDPINSAINSTNIYLGNNSIPVNTNKLSPSLVNIIRSMNFDENLYSEFDQLLLPETFNATYMAGNIVDYESQFSGATINYATGVITPSTLYKQKAAKSVRAVNNIVSYNEMNTAENNMLSTNNRGQIFSNCSQSRAATKWSKAVASMNYTMIVTAGTATTEAIYTMTVTTASTTLYTMYYNGIPFPTNVENWGQCLEIGMAVQQLFWYFNKPPYMAAGEAVVNDFSLATISGSSMTSTQSLIMTITIPEVKTPLINPLLDIDYNKSFSNVSKINVDVKLAAQDTALYNLITRQIGFPTSTMPYVLDYTANDPNNFGFPQVMFNNNIGAGSIYFSNSKLITRQYTSVLSPWINKITTLPYIQYDAPISVTISPLLNTVSEYQTLTVSLRSVIPEMVLIMIDSPASAVITDIQVMFNGETSIMNQKMDSLRAATRRNGLNWSNKNDLYGYSMVNNNSSYSLNPTGTTSGLSGLVDFSGKSTSNIMGNGSVLMLKMGTDIPLLHGGCVGLSGLDLNVMYKVSYRFVNPPGSANSSTALAGAKATLNIFHLINKDYIVQDGIAALRNDMFNITNYTKSVQEFKDLIINKHLRVNRNRLTGGNFFSNVFSKGRHILGKIHGAVSKAHGHVANAINHGQTAIELANAALPVAAKYNNSLGSFLERRKE